MLAEPRKHCGQEERGDGRDDAHAKLAGQGQRFRPRHIRQLLALAQHLFRLVGDLQAQRREAHYAAGSLDQRRSEQRFKLADSGGKRRLGDEAGGRRLAEMAMASEGDQILQLLERG